jgi:hypothetical protein
MNVRIFLTSNSSAVRVTSYMSEFKALISSTRIDLAQYREEVKNKLVALHQVVLMMETFGSNPSDAVTVSTDQVRECDLFIGIYAYRYGYVPAGDDKSITEQEYDFARELGKRCLCYVASESLKPEVVEEDESKQKRLADFKQRLDVELVRSVFDSPDDLREKVGDDVNRLLRGEPLGYSHQEVQERWLKWEGETRQHLFDEQLNNPRILIDSPLTSTFKSFINQQEWHEEVAEILDEIRAGIKKFPREENDFTLLDEIEQTITKIDTNEDYLILRDAIKTLPNKIDGVQRLFSQFLKAKYEPGLSFEERDLAKTRRDAVAIIRDKLIGLRNMSKQRSFARVVPVIGELGSGKTHAFASQLGQRISEVAYDYLLLPLARSPFAESIETMILRSVKEAAKMEWRSLEEFDRFLDSRYPAKASDPPRKIKLIIVLDDFQKGLFKSGKVKDDRDELLKFISHNTRLHSLHWLILLQDTFYTTVAEKAQSWFWEKYSYTSPEAIGQELVGKWLSLNELNRSAKTGLELIRTTLGAVTSEESLALDRVDDNPSLLNNLCSPFIAGVLLDLRDKLPLESLVDLNFIEFVTHFWEKRLAHLDTTSLDTDLTKLSVALIARSLLKREGHPALTDVLDDITGAAAVVRAELQNRDKAELALDILQHGNLLTIEGIPDPDLGGFPVQHVSIRFEAFWEWNIATQLRVTDSLKKADTEASAAELQKWFAGNQAQEIKAGVFTFLLLLLDQDARQNKTTSDFIEFILRLGVGSQDLHASGVWFAGPKASRQFQKALAKLAQEQAHHYDEPRALFGFMYFLAECLFEALDEPARLRLLQPYFELIDRYSLADYYKYIAERLLGNAKTDDVILSCMPYFSGCELLGITEDLAEITLYSTEGGPEETFAFVIKYLKANAELIEQEFRQKQKPEKGARYFYWEWFVCKFCRYLVDEKGLDAYDFLVQNNWYEAAKIQLEYPVSLRMRQEANLALGFWYRTQGRRAKQEYVDLVYELIDHPDIIQRETAFFLIRHTKTYERRRAVPLDKEFHPALKQIFLDPKMHRLVESHLDTFEINLDNFKKLDQQRRQGVTHRHTREP